MVTNLDRIKSGFGKFLKGALIAVAVVAVVAAVVCTGGAVIAAAAPFVAMGGITGALAVGTMGAAAVGMGATVAGGIVAGGTAIANAAEGAQDMYYGAIGFDKKSFNFVRDGLFGGSQEITDEFMQSGFDLMFTGAFITSMAAEVFAALPPAAIYADGMLSKTRGGSGNIPETTIEENNPALNNGNNGANKAKYTYNMVENPGPLAEMPGTPAANVLAGKYNEITLEEDTILYHSGQAGGLTIPGQEKNGLGQWFTREPTDYVAKVRIDSAVKAQWVEVLKETPIQ